MDDSQHLDMSAKQALDRKVRIKNLLDEVKNIETKFDELTTDSTLEHLRKLAEQSDVIIAEGRVSDRAEHTTEVVMDAQLLKMNHAIMSKLINQNEFKTQVYANAINSLVNKGGDEMGWDHVTELICDMACSVRVRPSMLGTFEFEVQEKTIKQRQQRKRTVVTEEKRPDVVKRLQRQDPGAQRVNMTQQQLADIFKKNNRKPIPFYQLIIDPKNFMNTVENALQIAFLVQSNRVAVETGEDNNPQVRLITSEERERVGNQSTNQAICTLNVELCNKMIRLYNIRQPMLTIQEVDLDDENEEDDI